MCVMRMSVNVFWGVPQKSWKAVMVDANAKLVLGNSLENFIWAETRLYGFGSNFLLIYSGCHYNGIIICRHFLP